ncbi:MAG: T9SS type A sorting domain-containing protein, partial [Candidatus Marinimicrobia bacterium]|nr:T9SS type A sorting domain-containing protein [Candidatus Neomarinimicrobiota bacterium]
VTVKVFNIVGLEITTLINDELSTGNHSIQWDGSRQPSGLYFVQIESGSFIVTKKMVLLK